MSRILKVLLNNHHICNCSTISMPTILRKSTIKIQDRIKVSRGCEYHENMSLVLRKPVFGVFDQVLYKPGCTATEDG